MLTSAKCHGYREGRARPNREREWERVMQQKSSTTQQSPLEEEEKKGLRWSSNNMMVFVPFEPLEEREVEQIEEIFAVAA